MRTLSVCKLHSVAAAQQVAGADRLIENPLVACLGFAAFRVVGGVTAKPGGGSAPVRR